MIRTDLLGKAWALLDRRERRNAMLVLAVVIVNALGAAAMVASVLPFLAVLAQPDLIHSTPALAWAYDFGGFDSDYSFLVALGLGSLLVIVATNLLHLLRTYVVVRFTTMRSHVLSTRLLSTYMRQPYEFFLNRHTGELGTKVLSEANGVVQNVMIPAAEGVASLCTTIAIMALLLWVNPVLALLAFAVFGGIYGATFARTSRSAEQLGRVRTEANRQCYRSAVETLGGAKDIKLLGREQDCIDRFAVPSQRMALVGVRLGLISQMPQRVMQMVAFGGMILLCLFLLDAERLASGTALGQILPTLGVFAFAAQRLIPELSGLYRSLNQLASGKHGLTAVHADLALSHGTGELPRRPPAPLGLKRSLQIEGVSYRYPAAQLPGLSNVSLTIRAGERIGIVGSTGAGKTTLADVVLGLLRPHEGRLVADGTEITGTNLRAWQQTVGYVPQNIFLSDAGVAENIALGVPPDQIDHDRVRAAARIAQIDRFVTEDLPEGYDTRVGERGVRLSGGQRQRVGIARALYHDADLIVFDEATSALDNLTEREVMAAISELPGDKTVLMIAHRLSTVQGCDRILVLDRGQVVGLDRWEALLETNDTFRRIAEAA